MEKVPDKIRILFVDDDPGILQGLKRMLFSMRREWDMVFAPGGEQALRALEAGGFHMMVTDLNMPGMDGMALLRTVRSRFPGVIRVVLSGSTQSDTGLQTVQLAHQYLAKPCSAEDLRDVIQRSRALRTFCTRGGILAAVSRIDSLPSLPAAYEELLQELASDRSSAASVGKIIERDAGMCAKVLQLANSAFFGLRKKVERPAQAVNYLGMETVRSLVLSANVFHDFTGRAILERSFESFTEHSLETGRIARALAERHSKDKVLVEHAFLAGLLHDVGKLVLAQEFPEECDRVLGAMLGKRLSVTEAEYEAFGATHAEVGAYLMGLWGLPDPVVEAIAFHHAPSRSPVAPAVPVAFVHVADVVENDRNAAAGLTRNYLDGAFLRGCRLPDEPAYWKKAAERADG